MDKKIFFVLIIFLLVFSSFTCYASSIKLKTAKQVAVNFYSEINEKVIENCIITEHFIEKEQSINLLYIFNFEPDGYVIVSGENSVKPILVSYF